MVEEFNSRKWKLSLSKSALIHGHMLAETRASAAITNREKIVPTNAIKTHNIVHCDLQMVNALSQCRGCFICHYELGGSKHSWRKSNRIHVIS
jgi:hypothetical protein